MKSQAVIDFGGTDVDSAPWVGRPAPFLHIDASEAIPAVAGTPRGFVGHRMDLPGDPRRLGLFAEWDWDGRTLTASVDTLGFFTLFVYAKGREIAVSPSILQLLAQGADPAPDPVAIAVFHRIGFFLEADTPFRFIRVLPPDGRLTWRDGVLEVQGGLPAPKTSEMTRDQAVEAFIDLPRATVGRFLKGWDGPIVVPLSGGRDSRHMLLELAHQGRKPDTCLTFHHGGRYKGAELQAARAVAERVGVRHTILGRPRPRLRDSIRALLLTQLCADEHRQMMAMHDYLLGSPAAAVDGIGGDILTNPDDSAADHMARARRGDYEGIARAMAHGHGRVVSRAGHVGGAGAIHSPGLDDAALDRIAGALRGFADAPDPYQAFWFWNRTRREISFVSTTMMGGAAMVFCPYLDPDFVELGLSLPWSVTKDQKLHDDAISRAFPEVADVPYASELRDQPVPRLRADRVTGLLDLVRVAALTEPDGALAGVRQALRPSPLARASADIYRLHKGFVDRMDAAEARRLIALGARLDRDAPKGEAVVTDVHPAT